MSGRPLAPHRALVAGSLSGRAMRRLLPAALSLTCLGLLLALFWDRLPAVLRLVQDADHLALGLATLAYLAALYVLAIRMRLVFRVFGIVEPSYRYFLYTLIGLFFGNFLPTAVGGDLLKASYAAGHSDRLGEAFAATFIDRGLGMFGIVVIGAAGLALYPGLAFGGTLAWLAPALVLAFVAVAAACQVEAWTRRGIGWIERSSLARRLRGPRMAAAAVQLLRAPGPLLAMLGLTVVAQALASLCLWTTARALHVELSYVVFLVVLPAVTVASMLPSLNGMGVREATLVVLLHGLVPDEQALALGLIFYGLLLVCSGLGGVVYLLRKPLGVRVNPRLVARFTADP